ncbi:MAG: GatB/YqeY domain-containing protein [Ilumatobacter sp.]|nr:MAG: GatB/YqeY domain-containing protein [Ilumatobacter sp.]
MTTLKDKIRDDLTAAMRDRDTVATSTLRMVLAAITNAEVAGDSAVALDDDAVVAVLAGEAKRRNEAAEIYESNDRPEAAASERAEAAIIARYLPATLDEGELRDLVTAVIADLGASTPREMGAVIAEVRTRGGSAVDGAAAAKEAKRQLTPPN